MDPTLSGGYSNATQCITQTPPHGKEHNTRYSLIGDVEPYPTNYQAQRDGQPSLPHS